MTKEEILFLAHRLPFPPNKGDKIRSYHLLRHLTNHYDVHIGCFVDDKEDGKYVGSVEGLCKSSCVRPLRPLLARLKSLRGFVTGQALTLPYYYDRRLAEWVGRTVAENPISAVVAFSSPMGQYVIGQRYSGLRRIMDFVDIDSDKWRQFAEKLRTPVKWIYSREAKQLSKFEQTVAEDFDAAVFVSDNETKMFARELPDSEDKLFTVSNGVDTAYFDPEIGFESPFDANAAPIVFTGVMDYWPNADAVCWFAKKIFPCIREAVTDAQLWIVGTSPTQEVRDLAAISGVKITGRVEDVRPYLKYASVAVAPLRMARGVQNKVLEALAMNKFVVCTPQAAAGLSNRSDAPITVADSESGLVAEVVEAFESAATESSSTEPRDYVLRHYEWSRNLEVFSELLGASYIEHR